MFGGVLMAGRRGWVLDGLRGAFGELGRFSVNGGWFLARELLPVVCEVAGRRVEFRSVVRHLMILEEQGEVEKKRLKDDENLNEWRYING